MAATVKTLLEHHGELYWGTRKANPGYCYGLALDVGADGLAAELVYVMSDLDENDEPLVTPEAGHSGSLQNTIYLAKNRADTTEFIRFFH